MRVVLIAVLLSASLCAALPPRFRSTSHLTAGEDCTAAKGVCQVGACDGMQVKGQCPGDGVCCIPNKEVQKCLDVKGTCRDKSKPAQACPGDAWSPGKCPGKFVCCASGAAQQQAPGPAVQAPQAPVDNNKKLLCMTFDDGPFDDVSFRIADAMFEAGVPSMFYVNCHKEMKEDRRRAWLAKLKQQGHSIGNHMCEHDIMAQSHYTKQYGALMRKPDGCLTTPEQQAVFRTHVNDNYALWSKYDWTMKTARLNGDGRFNPCVVNALANPTIPQVTAHKHVAWNFEVGPTMVANSAGSFVMPHLKNPTGIKSEDGYFLNSDPAGNPYGIILAHDLHYAKGQKVKMLQDWVKAQSAKGYTWGKIDDNGKCVPK